MKNITNPSGVFLRADLRLEILVDGAGLGITLTPAQARDLAGMLVVRAAVVEQEQASAEVGKDASRLLTSPN